MHDIVAHSLSVIVAQADGGRYAAAHDPRATQQSLETNAATGRSALGDMRRLLGVLRSDRDDPGLPHRDLRRHLGAELAVAWFLLASSTSDSQTPSFMVCGAMAAAVGMVMLAMARRSSALVGHVR